MSRVTVLDRIEQYVPEELPDNVASCSTTVKRHYRLSEGITRFLVEQKGIHEEEAVKITARLIRKRLRQTLSAPLHAKLN